MPLKHQDSKLLSCSLSSLPFDPSLPLIITFVAEYWGRRDTLYTGGHLGLMQGNRATQWSLRLRIPQSTTFISLPCVGVTASFPVTQPQSPAVNQCYWKEDSSNENINGWVCIFLESLKQMSVFAVSKNTGQINCLVWCNKSHVSSHVKYCVGFVQPSFGREGVFQGWPLWEDARSFPFKKRRQVITQM